MGRKICEIKPIFRSRRKYGLVIFFDGLDVGIITIVDAGNRVLNLSEDGFKDLLDDGPPHITKSGKPGTTQIMACAGNALDNTKSIRVLTIDYTEGIPQSAEITIKKYASPAGVSEVEDALKKSTDKYDDEKLLEQIKCDYGSLTEIFEKRDIIFENLEKVKTRLKKQELNIRKG
ncbi:MAG: hypothetical protein PHT54_02680 [Candidatus Nanoarchaeia archaeon]|nr:hypothetical protein [Candidatus Nanoarchaeia archaeon]